MTMTGKQSAVAVGGLGLVAVNYWTSAQRTAVVNTLWDKRDPSAAHRALLGIGGELLLVGVLAFAAGQSDALGAGMIAIIVSLWVLWAMGYYGRGGKRTSAAPPMQSQPAPQGGNGGTGPNPGAGGGGGGSSW